MTSSCRIPSIWDSASNIVTLVTSNVLLLWSD